MPLNLAPTLLIGLGGTGKDVLLRIRRLFFERFGLDPATKAIGYPIVGYLVLDTDEQKLDEIAGEPLPPFVGRNIKFDRGDNIPEAIICNLTPNQFNEYFAGGYQTFPHIFRWMPEGMHRLGSTALSQGAGQNRLFGRLAFFRHYRTIRATIEAKLAKLLQYAANPAYYSQWIQEGMEVDRNRIEVVLVYSLAGGTGAGMFLDVGMLVRDIISKNYAGQTEYITHYAVLPEVLINVLVQREQKEKVQENAFASLLEMEYFAQRKEGIFDLSIPPQATDFVTASGPAPLYEAQWERGVTTPIMTLPWNACYLIGASNDPLVGTPQSLPDLYQMIGEQIFLDFDPSDFGREKRSARSNLEDQLQLLFQQDIYDEDSTPLFPRFNSRRFSTFGLAQLQFDRDRMRRAAAHRFARRLIQWWGRDNQLGADTINQYAREDLGLAGDKPNSITITPEETTQGRAILRLDEAVIYERLVQRGSAADQTWGALIQDEYRQIRQKIEDGEITQPSAEPFTGWLARHRSRLTQAGPGTIAAEQDGIVIKTAKDNRDVLLPQIRERADRLFRYRVSNLGLRDSFKLFERYAELLQNQQRQASEKHQSRSGARIDEHMERVREAWSLPLGFARSAARIEMLQAAEAALQEIGGLYLQEIGGLYRRGIASEVSLCIGVAQRQFAPGKETEGSYTAAMTRFFDGIKRARDYLEDRFKELSAKDTGYKKIGRVTALIDQWDETEYDRKIALAMEALSIEKVDWSKVEVDVFQEMARSADRRLAGVKSLPDLILRYTPLDPVGTATPADYNQLANELAEACEVVLKRRFATDITALQEYQRQPDKDRVLDQLRTFSAPYLRRNLNVNIADEVNVNTKQLLGLANYDSTDAARFVVDLRRSGEKDTIPLAGLQSLNMKDDAIVLYREKAGIPICYYAELDGLGRLYDASQRVAEAHFDHACLQGKYPEVRAIDRRKQQLLGSTLELTFFGLMTGRMTCWFHPPEEKGAGEREPKIKRTFKFAVPGGLEYSLGSQIEEVGRRLVDQETLRNQLQQEIVVWLTERGPERKGLLLAILWASLRWLQDEVTARIQFIINRNPERYARQVEHPLLKLIRHRMLRKIRARLDAIPGGPDWIAPLLQWEAILMDRDATSDQKAVAKNNWGKYVAGTFKLLNQDDLPIPVLVQPTPGFQKSIESTESRIEG